ncbi:hypothetical protein QBC39DRAFT_113577 [Podospora conica]|nr:hypothetical protein QBC39DRAFT_113577 [Schizothecium conicum]
MKGATIDQLVWETMFPKPRTQDPPTFQHLLQRSLVLEVRQEVHSYYGHLDTEEAKYPGLDYTNKIHRIRLSRWPWHRRLFRAFDNLGLTHSEISSLTKWEGTKWAKERFEAERGITIRDTSFDEFPDFVPPEERPRPVERSQPETGRSVSQQEEGELPELATACDNPAEESDEELESVGEALNEQLRERVDLRNSSGDLSVSLNEQWEDWLKNAIESGDIHAGALEMSITASRPLLATDDIFPSWMVAAARSGEWETVPSFLRNMLRQSLEEQRTSTTQRRAPRDREARATSSLNPSSRSTAWGPDTSASSRSVLRSLLNQETARERRVSSETTPHVETS